MIFNLNNNISEEQRFNWTVLLVISFVTIVLGIYRDGFASLFPFLQKDFNLTRAQVGFYTTCLYLIASLVSIISGRLVDIKGSKWGMVFGVLFVGIISILHSIAPSFIILILLASFAGLGMSVNTPSANKAITEWFSYKRRSTATGIWSTALPIGGLIGAIILPRLGISIGWRKAIIFPGILSLLSVFIILYFYQDKRKEINNYKKFNSYRLFFRKSLSELINNIDLMIISSYGFFLGAAAGAISTHFTLFLFLDYGLTESVAGFGFALLQLGSILGRPMWGIICDKFLGSNIRKAFLFIGMIFFFISIIFGLFLKSGKPSVGIIFLLAFITGCSIRACNGLLFSSISEMAKDDQVGGAIGLSLFFTRTGMLLTPPIFGYIADLRKSYDLSWIILGLIIIAVSVGQYLFYINRKT